MVVNLLFTQLARQFVVWIWGGGGNSPLLMLHGYALLVACLVVSVPFPVEERLLNIQC
jgi:hypothetical protein